MLKHVKSVWKLHEIFVWKHGVMQAHEFFYYAIYWHSENAKARTITRHRDTSEMWLFSFTALPDPGNALYLLKVQFYGDSGAKE